VQQLPGRAQTVTPSEQATTALEKSEPLRLGETALNMYFVADDRLTQSEILEIKAAMEEKGYKDIFLSFKRLYYAALNNCRDIKRIKSYILKTIETDQKGLETA
jgi:hypothetical protein